MAEIKLYNTLSRKKETFKPIKDKKVGMYTCGPTVYWYQHIGNLRSYIFADILKRVLSFNNFKVKHVMNITDVGHLTSNADEGEDKMEMAAKKEGKKAGDIADYYWKIFREDFKKLNIIEPDIWSKATEHIKEQIELIKKLEKRGYTYKTNDGIYFDTSKLKDYGKLARLKKEGLEAGKRIKMRDKRNKTDFALWKFSPEAGERQQEWQSPWGLGFPGWHLECSTLAIKGLDTEALDIHTGGIDHIAIHHTNEIAQSEAATGKQFVKYWVHHNFLHVDGNKMSKSSGNIWTVEDIIKKGFDPLALRYLYLQAHYRQEMNFTWNSLEAAQIAYKRLIEEVAKLRNPKVGCAEFEENFLDAINDDLNMPKALGLVWELIKSDNPDGFKLESILKMDQVLGLDLEKAREKKKIIKIIVPDEVQRLIDERENLRKSESYTQADHLRNKIKKLGYNIKDSVKGVQIEKI